MTKFLVVATVLMATAAHAQMPSPAFEGTTRVLPDSRLTPGVVRSGVTAADLCPVAHTPALRNVPESEKLAVYKSYGIAPHQGYCAVKEGCEVDHLVSLELGGANDQRNLWPQAYSGTVWNAHVKDKYENWLHAAVCSGKLTLDQAQVEIRIDWIAGYRSHPELPIPAGG